MPSATTIRASVDTHRRTPTREGIADLQVLANLIPESGYLFGQSPTSVDAAIYGFIANILFYPIDTPLRQFVVSRPNLGRHCTAIHAAVGRVGTEDSTPTG